MRKFLVSACYGFALLFFCTAAPAAKADHGYRSSNGGYSGGYGGGYGGGYSAHDCQGHNSGYAQYQQYQSTIVPVYPGGIYQSYSFGGAPFGGYSNYGQVGFPYAGAAYNAGYGPGSHGPGTYGSGLYGSGYRSTLPRVQLRIGF